MICCLLLSHVLWGVGIGHGPVAYDPDILRLILQIQHLQFLPPGVNLLTKQQVNFTQGNV
jgi:hypothetical protein